MHRGGPVRIIGDHHPIINLTGEAYPKIDPIEVAKALGASKIVYVGKSKDVFDMYGKARQMIEKMAASCDDYDEVPDDDPLTDD
jgi:hypothetical protein